MGFVVSGTAIPTTNWAVINGVACKNMFVNNQLVWQHTVPVTNMLTNAGFSGGSTWGWEISSNNGNTFSEGSAYSGYAYSGWYSTDIGYVYQNVTMYQGRTYYLRARVETTCPNGAAPVRISGTTIANCQAPSGNYWVDQYLRFVWPLATGTYRFEVGGDANIGQANAACNIELLDLTGTFGAGAEPSNDTIFSWGWFDGTKQVVV